LKKYFLNR